MSESKDLTADQLKGWIVNELTETSKPYPQLLIGDKKVYLFSVTYKDKPELTTHIFAIAGSFKRACEDLADNLIKSGALIGSIQITNIPVPDTETLKKWSDGVYVDGEKID